jgi:branched-subunit amino acid transport protein
MKIWIIMLAAGLVTYGLRLSFIIVLGKRDIHPNLLRALGYVPPAVLSAIIFPEVLMQNGSLAFTAGNPRLLAGLAAALVAWRTRSVVFTIVVGMLVLLALQAIQASP